MSAGKTVSKTLGALAALSIVATTALVIWIRWEAARTWEPDHRAEFFEPVAVPVSPVDRTAAFSVARVGERFEIVDHEGRVVLFRGVNMGSGSRVPPFRPIALEDEEAFEQLRSWGVNAVRLQVPWEALETGPRQFNLDHLEYIRWFLDAAHLHGMAVIVDHHQEYVSRCLGGTGAPRWAHRKGVIDPEALERDCTYVNAPGLTDLPRHLRWWADFWDGTWTPDDLSLQDHVIWAFHKLAEVLQSHEAVVGYGLFNEPQCFDDAPGSLVYAGAKGCEDTLREFYRRFATTVRNVDRDALFFFDPAVRPLSGDWDGRETGLSAPPLGGSVFSVHPPQGDESDVDGDHLSCFLQNALTLAGHGLRVPLLLAEFGVRGDADGAPEELMHQMVAIEDAGVSAFYRDYSRTGRNWAMARDNEGSRSLVVPHLFAENPEQVGMPRCFAAAFVRPYPQRIAGIPVSHDFDRSFTYYRGRDRDVRRDGAPVTNTDVFTLVFRQSDVEADTLVYVPRKPVYGEDPATEAPEFIVTVSDGTWRWSRLDPNVLAWTTDPGVAEHTITIKPWGGQPATGAGVGECL
ncbi:MAG: cellulase family glycosylhydrolase [Deltaproteobacteria bacterium]|nr:cellulase family glycosylhydrolase [Deltaproteobacteria bacterium]